MKTKRRISRFTTSLLLIFLTFIVFFLASAKISGSTPNILGFKLLTVLSGSMEPSIHTGSIIAIRLGDATSYKVGDVITYRSLEENSLIITHRIVEVKSNGSKVEYITKGDNNEAKDPKPIPASYVVGQYANFTVPLLGYLFTFAKSKIGIIILLVIPSAVLIIWQLISFWRAVLQLEQKKEGPPQNV